MAERDDDVAQEAYLQTGSAAATLHARARRVMPGGNSRTTVFHAPYPDYAAHAQGATIVDVDGQARLDFLNNYTSLIHGHADSDITAAVVAQLPHGSAFAMPTEHEIRLAELLVERIASVEQVRFTNSGSEAVMMAIKAARAYTGRPKIMKFEGCYHGSYDFVEVSMATPQSTWSDADPAAVPYSAGTPQAVLESVVVSRYNDLDTTERLIERHKDELAAVIVDLMPLRAGMAAASDAFLGGLRALTSAYGIVLICDEVITLRNAWGGTQGVRGFMPDLTTMGKIIGGGFPVGAVGGSVEVMSVFDPTTGHPRVPHGGTFNANPITMVAGYTAMQKMSGDAYVHLDRLGVQLREGIAEMLDGARLPGQVTGAGSLFAIHLHDRTIREYRDSVPTDEEQARVAALYHGLQARGIIVTPTLSGCLSTPMGEAEVHAFLDAFHAALSS